MPAHNKRLLSLSAWILGLILIGGLMGFVTKPEIGTWYSNLHRSPLTPPNAIFPIAWTILYGMIGACGWLIWGHAVSPQVRLIKSLYLIQLMLNWSWTPLFFHYHLTLIALMVLVAMDILVAAIIFLAYRKMRMVALLMLPYWGWILFASYLNWYIMAI